MVDDDYASHTDYVPRIVLNQPAMFFRKWKWHIVIQHVISFSHRNSYQIKYPNYPP